MNKYVVDTSVSAKLFLEDEDDRDTALEVFRQGNSGAIVLISPSLTWYELNNVLAKEKIPLEDIKRHLSLFRMQVKNNALRVISVSEILLNKSSELSMLDTQGKGYISSYDATFHALALLENASLITADEKHYNKTKNLIGSVMLLKDFGRY